MTPFVFEFAQKFTEELSLFLSNGGRLTESPESNSNGILDQIDSLLDPQVSEQSTSQVQIENQYIEEPTFFENSVQSSYGGPLNFKDDW